MIGGAPYSSSVINFARQNNASCVRGLIEDRVLLTRQRQKVMGALLERELHNHLPPPKLYVENQPVDAFEAEEQSLARSLTEPEAEWLESCPLILRVGDIRLEEKPSSRHERTEWKSKPPGHEALIVVHAGLVPGLPLDHQDPLTLMSVKSVALKSRLPSNVASDGVRWSRVSLFSLVIPFFSPGKNKKTYSYHIPSRNIALQPRTKHACFAAQRHHRPQPIAPRPHPHQRCPRPRPHPETVSDTLHKGAEHRLLPRRCAVSSGRSGWLDFGGCRGQVPR